jgi:hypothetical protein
VPIAVFCLALIAAGFSGSLFANAGVTSADVTTTVGNSTDPSPDVQSQSAGFVQQNQQLQNGATPNGTTATSAIVATTATSGTPSAGNAGNADATQQGQAGAAAAPAAAPAPPPTYESTMRRLDRRNDIAPTVVASGPPGAVRKPESAEPAKPVSPEPAAAPASTSTNAPAAQANNAAIESRAERILQPPAVTGGRAAAPDGFTFYSGLTVAGALLAFAFATFLRIGRSET